MEIMEAIKFIAFYGLEITVVGLVGVTLFAGIYQLVRDKVSQARRAPLASQTER